MKILKQPEWTNESFKDLQLEDVDFGGMTFDECEFIDCAFIKCNFRNASFGNCTFNNCNLSNLPLTQTKVGEVIFCKCKLVGLDFSVCKKLLFSIKLDTCILQMCNFSRMKMDEFSFTGSEFKDCDFYEADLSGSDFSRCDLKGSLFENCDLKEADFRHATNYLIDPAKNKVRKGKYSMPEVLSFLAPLELDID